jgi:HEAT repeat protein
MDWLKNDVPGRGALTGVLALALLFAVGPLAAAAQESFEDQVANLKSPTAKTRQAAAEALGESRRHEAVAPLSALVRDPEPRVRLEVVLALTNLRDLAGVPALVTSLQDGDPKVREQAISGLVEIYSERERTGAASRFLQMFSDEFKGPVVPPFTTVDPAVFQGLTGTLRDEERNLRAESAQAIGVGDEEQGKAIIPLLADDSSQVRNRSIEAVGALQVTEAGPALRELYEQNERRPLGTRALGAMVKTGDPNQADLYRQLLMSGDLERRRMAVEGLARVSDASMIDGFKKDFQRERNTDVRLAYNFAITLLGDRAFIDSIVLALPEAGGRGERARGYIEELGPSFTVNLYPYLQDPDPKVRAALCDVLAGLGDPVAIEWLTPMLGDPDSDVVDRANRAIQTLHRAGGAPTFGQ